MNIDCAHGLAEGASSPASLPLRWRESADQLRVYGAEAQATALERCAAELEGVWREWELEPLTVKAAAKECGYTRSHLKRLIRDQAIPNSGSEGSPRILRTHLPKKPGVALPIVGVPNTRTQVARAIAEGGEI